MGRQRRHITTSRRLLSGEHPEQAMWLKYVDPDETEGERYTVYEENAAAPVKPAAKRSRLKARLRPC